MSVAENMVQVLQGLQGQIIVLMNRSTVLEQIVDEQDTTLAACRNLLLISGVSQESFEAERARIAEDKAAHEEAARARAEEALAAPLPDLITPRASGMEYPPGTFIFGGDGKPH